jgi:hypothetical protein
VTGPGSSSLLPRAVTASPRGPLGTRSSQPLPALSQQPRPRLVHDERIVGQVLAQRVQVGVARVVDGLTGQSGTTASRFQRPLRSRRGPSIGPASLSALPGTGLAIRVTVRSSAPERGVPPSVRSAALRGVPVMHVASGTLPGGCCVRPAWPRRRRELGPALGSRYDRRTYPKKSEGSSQQLEPSVVDPEPSLRRILRRTVLGDGQVFGGRDQSHGPTSLRDLPPLRVDVLLVPLM